MYLRLSPYREVLQGVLTSLQINEGIIKITGKSGSGKTALCSQLFHELQDAGQPAVFFLKPPASAVALQNDILDNLALDPTGNFTRTLTAWLLARQAPQQPLVLIFDDAQQLDPPTFGAIRMLCNIQDNSRGMVRVILCGTEELDEKLASPALRAVTQFLNQSFTLPYLTQEQVNDFCHAYWMLQGEERKPMSEKLLQNLHRETRGQPGILQARLNQGSTGAERAERQDRAGEMPFSPARPYRYAGPRKNWIPALLIIAGLIVLGGAGAYLFVIPSFFDDTVVTTPALATQRPVAPVPAPAVNIVEEAAPAIESVPASELAIEESTPTPEAATEETVEAAVAEEAVATAPEATEAAPVIEEAPVEVAALPPVEDFLAAWTTSWQNQDLDAYLAHYHPDFVPPQGATRADWEAQRRRVIGNAKDIEISTEAPEEVRDAQDGMRLVRFWLNYSAANYADRTLKELLLAPLDGTWRIRAENNLRTERQ